MKIKIGNPGLIAFLIFVLCGGSQSSLALPGPSDSKTWDMIGGSISQQQQLQQFLENQNKILQQFYQQQQQLQQYQESQNKILQQFYQQQQQLLQFQESQSKLLEQFYKNQQRK